ncbi:YbaB/EbfC family nucleoid-associated protein [Desulfobulbus sp. F5]|nr:YbaB/EbfC family nucleoid-associated protein [Desulfobulbus sp. F5]
MNIAEMMKQAKELQEKMGSVQADLAGKSVIGSAGGGMVTATMNGKGELIGLKIEKEMIRPEEAEMLQDLIVAAVSDGARKAAELGRSEISKLTGGLKIPGFS